MDLMNTLSGLFGLVIFVMCAIGGAMMMEAMVGTLYFVVVWISRLEISFHETDIMRSFWKNEF